MYHHHQSVLAKGRSFTANAGTKAAVLPKGRSSTTNSGTQVAVLLWMDRSVASRYFPHHTLSLVSEQTLKAQKRSQWHQSICNYKDDLNVCEDNMALDLHFALHLRGTKGEISNFYKISARFLIRDTHIPHIKLHTLQNFVHFCLIFFEYYYDFCSFWKKGLFWKSISSNKFEVYDLEFFYNISDTSRKKAIYPYLRNLFWEERK